MRKPDLGWPTFNPELKEKALNFLGTRTGSLGLAVVMFALARSLRPEKQSTPSPDGMKWTELPLPRDERPIIPETPVDPDA